MQHFAFWIDQLPHEPRERGGYVRAETVEAALRVVNDPGMNLIRIPDPFDWPGPPDAQIVWDEELPPRP